MTHPDATKPVVMAIGGLDPSGADGVAADILAIASLGGHCAPVVTVTQARDTREVKDGHITTHTLLIEQMRAVLEDSPVNLFKLGDCGNRGSIEVIHTILGEYADIPLILAPPAATVDQTAEALRLLLLPRAELLVLDTDSARRLAPAADSPAACARALLDTGAGAVLLTGVDRNGGNTLNQLFSPHQSARDYRWECLPATFQGATSTLAAAVACYRAHGISLAEAVQEGQRFTWRALQQAYRIGMGRLVPDRLHWCR